MLPRQRPLHQHRADRGQDRLGFGHAAGAMLAAGHLALVWADKADAVIAQGGQIALGGGVLPHAHIHSGGQKYGRVGRQKQG